jgi:hypothetical protein
MLQLPNPQKTSPCPQGGSCVMAINSNTFAGEVPPKLDPPSTPVLPQYIRGDADKLLQAASQAALEKAVTAATNHAKQWAANVHPETVPAAARGAPKAPGLELEADGAVGCWMEGGFGTCGLFRCLCPAADDRAAPRQLQHRAAGYDNQAGSTMHTYWAVGTARWFRWASIGLLTASGNFNLIMCCITDCSTPSQLRYLNYVMCLLCHTVADNVALLSLKTGQLLLVSLRFEGTAASKMQVRAANAPPSDATLQAAAPPTPCNCI